MSRKPLRDPDQQDEHHDDENEEDRAHRSFFRSLLCWHNADALGEFLTFGPRHVDEWGPTR